MKKKYIAPELELIQFDITDIITHSNAMENGNDGTDIGGLIGGGGNDANPFGLDDFNII